MADGGLRRRSRRRRRWRRMLGFRIAVECCSREPGATLLMHSIREPCGFVRRIAVTRDRPGRRGQRRLQLLSHSITMTRTRKILR
jgi:hypothetical protein